MTTAATVVPVSCFSSSSSCCPNRIHHHHHQQQQQQRSINIRISSSSSGGEAKSIQPFSTSIQHVFGGGRRNGSFISCQVALKPDASSVGASSESESESESEEEKLHKAKIGSRVRVKGPQLKVYHVPKVPEMDIAGMEGEIKQYVPLWKGKRISANFPFKIEFFTEIEGRGRVKFLAHLREDEFEYI